MAGKKVGVVIKEARTAAGLTQAKLAAKVSGVSATDIGRVERGEINLTNEQLKRIAKALGVTQASLLNAPKNSCGAASSSASSNSSSSSGSMRLTATEKRLVKAYREASTEAKKSALAVLTGKSDGAASIGNTLSDVLGDVLGGLIK